MKKINLPKIIWVSCIFLGLIVILISVMDYKIHYEYLTKNKIYFYECSGALCTTEVKDDSKLLYSEYECEDNEECPTLKSELNDTYVILTNNNTNILFNYREGKTISTGYEDYQLINNNHFIVTKNNYQGIINIKNEVTVPIEYTQLGYPKEDNLTGYNQNYIIGKKDDKYGIVSINNGKEVEEFKYDETNIEELFKLINDDELLL